MIVTAFYDVYPLPGLRVTEIVGAAFPLILIVYFLEKRPPLSGLQKRMLLLMFWIFLSSLILLVNFEFNFQVALKDLFKHLNGAVVFIAFPLLFRTIKDVNLLMNAFLISTIFPVLQIAAQYLFGANFLGLKARVSGDITMYEGVYGNHGVFGLISWIGALTIIAKLGINKKKHRFLYVSLFMLYLLVGFTTLSRTIMVLMLVILFGFITLLFRTRKAGVLLITFFLGIIVIYSPIVDFAFKNIKARSQYEIEVLRGERDIAYGMHGRIGRWDKNLDTFFNDYSILDQLVGTDLYIGPHGDYFFWLFKYGFIGLLLYLSFIFSLLFRVKNRVKRVSLPFHKYYGAAVLLGIIIWMLMAISTNPSFMPDFGYFVLGNGAVFLFITGQGYNQKTVFNTASRQPGMEKE
jgi:O-antigen ligase